MNKRNSGGTFRFKRHQDYWKLLKSNVFLSVRWSFLKTLSQNPFSTKWQRKIIKNWLFVACRWTLKLNIVEGLELVRSAYFRPEGGSKWLTSCSKSSCLWHQVRLHRTCMSVSQWEPFCVVLDLCNRTPLWPTSCHEPYRGVTQRGIIHSKLPPSGLDFIVLCPICLLLYGSWKASNAKQTVKKFMALFTF